MNTITITDEKYNTVESLLDVSGDLNTAVVKSEYFKNLKIYKKIIDSTAELNVFDGIEFKHRFWFCLDKMTLCHCKQCGKPYVFFRKCQRRFALCRHHDIDKLQLGHILIEAKRRRLEEFMKKLADKRLFLSDAEYSKTLNELNQKKNNYAFIVTRNDLQDFYHDLIIKTIDIIPLQQNDLMISKRIYLSYNKMSEEPKCKFCGKNKTVFINRIKGYNDSCNDCSRIKYAKTKAMVNKELIDKNFNFEKYEILKYPQFLNYGYLTIKCKNCGAVSDIIVNNGKIEYLKNTGLCSHCERKYGWEETDLYNFILKIYHGKIIHGTNSRKIIYPYELDFYLPDLKLAFEYDGLYWHSEECGKGRNYHKLKTDMCDKLGIKLIHIFSHEWLFKNEIVKSRIKNMLGIFDSTIYARKCQIKIVNSHESKKFQNENHMQGYSNASVNIGLYHENELISLMTFAKCRFDKKHEWEMTRFCNKIGYHIPGAASKLLKYFEINYKPRSIVTYADRRWSNGNLYNSLNFELLHISNPNYWYFKTHDIEHIYSRVNFQKHKLKDKLEIFDENKSEAENMKANGYSRIFDCGNMVFEKIYNQ